MKTLPFFMSERVPERALQEFRLIWLFLRMLGFGEDEIDQILEPPYPALADEIQQLGNLHGRLRFLVLPA